MSHLLSDLIRDTCQHAQDAESADGGGAALGDTNLTGKVQELVKRHAKAVKDLAECDTNIRKAFAAMNLPDALRSALEGKLSALCGHAALEKFFKSKFQRMVKADDKESMKHLTNTLNDVKSLDMLSKLDSAGEKGIAKLHIDAVVKVKNNPNTKTDHALVMARAHIKDHAVFDGQAEKWDAPPMDEVLQCCCCCCCCCCCS